LPVGYARPSLSESLGRSRSVAAKGRSHHPKNIKYLVAKDNQDVQLLNFYILTNSIKYKLSAAARLTLDTAINFYQLL
jgi:hypothetical protein